MRARIEKLVYGGEGLAREKGEALFVPFVLPGEEVEIEAEERKKKFVRARVTQVVKASVERVPAACPHFGVCGGCNYQHITYPAQLRYKEEILRETLRRLGRIDWQGPVAVHASPPWEYRNRAQWKIRTATDERTRTKSTAAPQMGYFRARSSALCPVEACPILSPKLFATFEAIRSALREGKLPATLQEVEAFVDAVDQGLLLNVTCTSLPQNAEAIAKCLSESADGVKSILVQDARGERMSLHGPGFLQYRALSNSLRVGHLSFFQVNRFLIEEMAAAVAEAAGSGELAFDLYAGVGLFATTVARHFARVEAVEANPASARDLETNAALSGKIVAARNESTETFLARWRQKRSAPPDVAIADPPRAGLERQALEKLLEIAPQRIVYVSCDPATLARDLAHLCAKMYHLDALHLFDMFPQTYHIETLARLERAR